MFLLQKRDMKNKIWYPAMLGLFGGKIEKNENENQALRRRRDCERYIGKQSESDVNSH